LRESNANFYDPIWYEIKGLSQLLLYPLEIRDWFIEDAKTNFGNVSKTRNVHPSSTQIVSPNKVA